MQAANRRRGTAKNGQIVTCSRLEKAGYDLAIKYCPELAFFWPLPRTPVTIKKPRKLLNLQGLSFLWRLST